MCEQRMPRQGRCETQTVHVSAPGDRCHTHSRPSLESSPVTIYLQCPSSPATHTSATTALHNTTHHTTQRSRYAGSASSTHSQLQQDSQNTPPSNKATHPNSPSMNPLGVREATSGQSQDTSQIWTRPPAPPVANSGFTSVCLPLLLAGDSARGIGSGCILKKAPGRPSISLNKHQVPDLSPVRSHTRSFQSSPILHRTVHPVAGSVHEPTGATANMCDGCAPSMRPVSGHVSSTSQNVIPAEQPVVMTHIHTA